MTIKEAILETVCGITTAKLPDNTLPEIALAGRSNVGKSSLINNLVNRRSLARTSSEPGKTRTLNYYRINKAFYLVDLPGYGYAKVSVSEREKWGRMIDRYLTTSRQLKNVFLLVDLRHDPTADDKQMFDWIVASGKRPVVIATKADKLKRSELSKKEKAVRDVLGLTAEDKLIKFSAGTGLGREEILDLIESLIL